MLVAFLYVATSPYHQGLNNPNEMVRVYMTRALVRDHTSVIDKVVNEWGGVDDKAIRDGKLYSSKAPLQSLAGVPIYAALWRGPSRVEAERREVTTLLRRGASVVPGLVLAFAIMHTLRRRAEARGLGTPTGVALGLTTALGTMLFPYAITFTGHIWAAATAGGLLYALSALHAAPPGSRRRDALSVLAGALAGAAPFAEYPAALMALPLLAAGPLLVDGARARLRFLVLGALGGLPPFLLGLWAHADAWGSPFKTGYAFLENTAYVEVHKGGFFGVGAPKLVAFGGALFSPGTGLFFYAPVLALGAVGLVVAVIGERSFAPRLRTPRALAVAALVGVVLELLFISAHTGWRGGWTLGPRYIIAVAPVLAFFVVEGMGFAALRAAFPTLAVLSLLFTGAAAALYPHLSDVYANPLISFLWPAYREGYASYGLADAWGLVSHRANLVHLVPLGLAAAYVAVAQERSARAFATTLLTTLLAVGAVAAIPEPNPDAARAETQRLFGFWEPPRERLPPPPPPVRSVRADAARIVVEAVAPDGAVRPCARETPDRCRYGDADWHHFAPEALDFDGQRRPILYLHPIAGRVVRARIPIPGTPRRVIFRYGLADASAAATNPAPVELTLATGDGAPLGTAQVGKQRGLHALPLELPRPAGGGDATLVLELRVADEGARTFGFDVELPE